MVRTDQPLLKIPNRSISKWDNRRRAFAQLRAERLDAGDVLESGFRETREAFETIRVNRGTGCDILAEKPQYRGGLEIGNHAHAGAAGSPTTLLHCHQDESGSPILQLAAAA